MKKKILLSQLKIKSFVTSLNQSQAYKIKGGTEDNGSGGGELCTAHDDIGTDISDIKSNRYSVCLQCPIPSN